MTFRQSLVVALSLLLILPPIRPAAAQSLGETIDKKVSTSVEKQVAAAIEELRAEMEKQRLADREVLLALIQSSLQPRETLEAEVEKAEKTLDKETATQAGADARRIVDEMPIEDLRSIERDTPREEVERIRDLLDEKSRELRDLAEEKRAELRVVLERSCDENLLGKEIEIGGWSAEDLQRAFESLSTIVEIPDEIGGRDEIERLILSLSENGRWTSHLLAWLPDDLLPECARVPEVRQAAKASSEVDVTAQTVQTILQAAMSAALASGNPWAIAIVAVLMILAALFTGGGGGGNGDGGGGKKGKNEGDQDGDADGVAGGQPDGPPGDPADGEPGDDSGGETDIVAPPVDRTVELDPNGEWKVVGSIWPTYEFVHRDDPDLRCDIDFGEVLRADTGESANLAAASLRIEAVRCDPDGRHTMTIQGKLPEDDAARPYALDVREGSWHIQPAMNP